MGTYNDIDSLGIARLKAAQELQAQQQKAQQKPSPIPPPYMNMDEDVPVIPAGTPETYPPIEGDRSSASDATNREPANMKLSPEMKQLSDKASLAPEKNADPRATATNEVHGKVVSTQASPVGMGKDDMDAYIKALADYRESDMGKAYKNQEAGIAAADKQRQEMYAQPLGLNLQPAYNTLDALYGTKTAKNYAAPMTQEEKDALNIKLMSEIQKGRQGLTGMDTKYFGVGVNRGGILTREELEAKLKQAYGAPPKPTATPKDTTPKDTNSFIKLVQSHPAYKQLVADQDNFTKAINLYNSETPIGDILGRDKMIKSFNPRITTAEQTAAKNAVPDGLKGRFDTVWKQLQDGKILDATRGEILGVLGALQSVQAQQTGNLRDSVRPIAKRFHIDDSSWQNEISPYLFQKSTTPISPVGGSREELMKERDALLKKAGKK